MPLIPPTCKPGSRCRRDRERVAGRCNLLEINGTDSPLLIPQGNSREIFGRLIGPRLSDLK
jgi:hypothetical protein